MSGITQILARRLTEHPTQSASDGQLTKDFLNKSKEYVNRRLRNGLVNSTRFVNVREMFKLLRSMGRRSYSKVTNKNKQKLLGNPGASAASDASDASAASDEGETDYDDDEL
jgi:hypothetical protein